MIRKCWEEPQVKDSRALNELVRWRCQALEEGLVRFQPETVHLSQELLWSG